MMTAKSIQSILNRALDDARDNHYAGYDPYDALNSSFGALKSGKWPPVLSIQLMKRNPINLRPLLGIQPGHNPKGIGLFLEACALLDQDEPESKTEEINILLQLLNNTQTPGYSGVCWGYNFDWASPAKVLPKGSPTAVVTGFISKALYETVALNRFPLAAEMFRNIAPFMRNDLPKHIDKTGICISYSTVKKDCCYNASLLAAGYFARLWHLDRNEDDRLLTRKLVDFVIARQKVNGSWAYSEDLETGKERIQTDFHQGFILDSISECMDYLEEEPQHWKEAMRSGATFYFNEQFAPDGRSYFRLPRKYPTDVHHQAQGVLTAIKLSKRFPEFAKYADSMVNWAIKNMYNGKGRFYYRVFPLFKDKTHYIRWGQGWMALALTYYYLHLNQRNE